MFALLLASTLAASAPDGALMQRRERAGPAPARRESIARGFGVGFGLGPHFHLGYGPAGIKVGPRFSYELAPLSAGLSVAITFPITLSYSRAVASVSTIERTGVELLPGARVSWEFLPKLRFYGDLGLGAVLYRYDVQLQGRREGSAAGFGVRLGVGAEYALLDKLSLFVEPMQLLLQWVPTVVFQLGGETVSSTNMPPHWGIVLGVHYRL